MSSFFCFASDVLRRFYAFCFMRSPAVNALPLRNFVSIASGFLLFRGGCAQTLLCVLLYAFSGSGRAVPLRNFVSIASGFLLFRVGCAQTLLSVRLYALSGSERTSAPELCQYSIGFSSVLRRICSDAFKRSPAVNALFRSGILSVSPRAFFCFASDVLRRFYAFGFMRYQAVNALPLRNFVSIASGFLLFCVGCAQTLLCVLLYAFSGSERAVPLRNFVSIASGFLLFRVGYAQTKRNEPSAIPNSLPSNLNKFLSKL